MSKIVKLNSGVVAEIIPEYALPVEKWYPADFACQCLEAPDEVQQGWYYDGSAFSKNQPLISDTVKLERSAAIKAACAEAITGGFDADVLGRGSLHYTLTEIQQRDLQTQYAAVKAGATTAWWHDTSRVTHEAYTAAQFKALFTTGYAYMISCKIRSDWLEQYAIDLAAAGDLTTAQTVGWDTVLPDAYQTQANAQIAALLEAADA